MEQESDKVVSYSITDEDEDLRIDSFLASKITDLTRSRVQQLIKEGYVEVNGRPPKTSHRLRAGDQVRLSIPPVRAYRLEPEPVEFTLIYEDSSLIVLNKPPGLVIHPAPGHPTGTLVHGLLDHSRDLSGIGGILRPGIVHRLDKDTSGLVVVAKSDRAHRCLAEQFKSGRVKKRYLALVHGMVEGTRGRIDLPIARHQQKRKEMTIRSSGGKRALTTWERIEEIGLHFSLLAVTPKTGRTHQIRVHLSHVGHPIVGDAVYGRKWNKHCSWTEDIGPQIRRQMLHAETLAFVHPVSKSHCEFKAPLPQDMDNVLRLLRSFKGRDKKA